MTDTATEIVVPVFHSLTGIIIWGVFTVLMPIVVGTVTNWRTSSAVKSLGLVFLSLANGVLSEWLAAGDGYDWRKAVLQALVSFIVAAATYAHVWKPLGVAAAALNIGSTVKYEKHADGVYRPVENAY